MTSLEHYKKLNYRMIIEYSDEDKTFYLKFPDLPGCIADGYTPERAVKKALSVKNEWLAAALDAGWTIPEPTVIVETSGRITLRTPRSLHIKLADRAQLENISINQLVLSYISEGLERASAYKKFDEKVDQLNGKVKALHDMVHRHAMNTSWRAKGWEDLRINKGTQTDVCSTTEDTQNPAGISLGALEEVK